MYSEVDMISGEVYEKKFENYAKDVTGGLLSIHDNHLFYSVYKKGCEIGIIDLRTREIIKEQPLNLAEGVQIGAPVVTDDKLYVLDSENVLHIYEKEVGE